MIEAHERLSMRIAITGATGLVGTALAEYLEGAGHEIHRIRRGTSDDRLADWNPAVGWIRPGALDGLDAIVHLAGEPIAGRPGLLGTLRIGRWSPARRERVRTSRVNTTRLLVDHLAALPHPPRVFVAASAIGYFGNRGDDVLTEDSGSGGGFLATVVRDWEQTSLSAEHQGMRTVVLRFGHVLSGQGGLLGRMLPPFRLGLGARFGSGRQYLSWIAIDDLVRVIEFALTSEVRGVFNATASAPVTNAALTKALGRALHRPVIFVLPASVLRLVLGSGVDEMLLWGQRVMPSRLMAAGFEYRYPDMDSALGALFPRRETP